MRSLPAALLVALLLAAVAANASLYGNVSIAELRKGVREAFERVAGVALNETLVLRALSSLESCATGPVKLEASRMLHVIRHGGAGGDLLGALIKCPSCVSGCNASTVYLSILASMARRVGNLLVVGRSPEATLTALLAGLDVNEARVLQRILDERVDAWALLATLSLNISVDSGFWSVLLDSNLLDRCLAVVLADPKILGEASNRLLAVLASRHPLEAVSTLDKRTRIVCILALVKLYALGSRLNTSEVTRSNLSVSMLNALLALAKEGYAILRVGNHLVAINASITSNLSVQDGFEYELNCLIRVYTGASLTGQWLFCSRDPLLSKSVEGWWLLWGHRFYTTRINKSVVKALEECAHMSLVEALASYTSRLYIYNITALGCYARLAAVRSSPNGIVVDWVAVRFAGWLAARRLGLVNITDLRLPPADPMLAWALGYIRTISPPRNTSILHMVLEAWRATAALGAASIAERLGRLANEIARGNYTGAVQEALRLRNLLEAGAGAFNPKVARLLAQAASIETHGETITVDLETAAKLLSKMLRIEPSVAKALLQGDYEEIIRMVVEGKLSPSEASKLIEAVEVPPALQRYLQRLLASFKTGDLRALSLLIRIAEAGAAAAKSSRGAPTLSLPPVPVELLGLAAVTVASMLSLYATLAVLQGRLARLTWLRRLRGYRAEMAKLLALLERRYSRREACETLREYGYKLPGDVRGDYMRAVEAYEEARFGGRGADRAAEVIREVRDKLGSA